MQLPGAQKAIVEPDKVRDYLLSLEHPVGGAKARFFLSLGFSRDRWPELQKALLALAQTADAELGAATQFGQKYVVRGMLEGPTGQRGLIESAWIVLVGEDVPRLITAYPGDRK